MNLQICAPYQPCVYHCPMCIARNHKHGYNFDNLYFNDTHNYLKRLEQVIENYDIHTVILTGECEPTQNRLWLIQTVVDLKYAFGNDVKIELQTHNFNLTNKQIPAEIDTICYSITSVKDYLSAWRYVKPGGGMTSRATILLVDDFNFLNKENFSPMGFNQITFKTLQLTEDANTNLWIINHQMSEDHLKNIYDIMEAYNGASISIRIDTNCQEANGRYYIFRSDGKVYDSWESKNSIIN